MRVRVGVASRMMVMMMVMVVVGMLRAGRMVDVVFVMDNFDDGCDGLVGEFPVLEHCHEKDLVSVSFSSHSSLSSEPKRRKKKKKESKEKVNRGREGWVGMDGMA